MFIKFLCKTLLKKQLPKSLNHISIRHIFLMNLSMGKCQKYSTELENTTISGRCFNQIIKNLVYEKLMITWFRQNLRQSVLNCKHTNPKQHFIYLLMDPGITNNLDERSFYIDKLDAWRCFLDSIFYVGKGKAARPYTHFTEAFKIYGNKTLFSTFEDSLKYKLASKPKLRRILEIWSNDLGVISLQAFHNTSSAEAHTREAAIIDAIGLANLTNQKRGQYYGIVDESYSAEERRSLGVVLLYKAMHIYLCEGESYVAPLDLIKFPCVY